MKSSSTHLFDIPSKLSQCSAMLRRVGLGVGIACALSTGGLAHAQSDTSMALSALPVASVASVASAASESTASQDVGGSALLTLAIGASLVVDAVEASADGVTYIIKNVAKGTSAAVKVSGQVVGAGSVAVGTVVESSAVGAGVILSAAGKVLAFIPNTLGQALMHNERL